MEFLKSFKYMAVPRNRDEQFKIFESITGLIGAGYTNDVFALESGDVAKMFHLNIPEITQRGLRTESHYLRELSSLNKSFDTPQFISENWSRVALGDRSYLGSVVMGSMANGNVFSVNNALKQKNSPKAKKHKITLEKSAATFLAELHSLKPKPLEKKSILEVSLEDMEQYDPHQKQNRKFYRAVLKKLKLMESSSPRVFCHGDLEDKNNLFFNRNLKVTGTLDFADSGYGMPEVDSSVSDISYHSPSQPFADLYEDKTGYRFDPDKALMAQFIITLRHVFGRRVIDLRNGVKPEPISTKYSKEYKEALNNLNISKPFFLGPS